MFGCGMWEVVHCLERTYNKVVSVCVVVYLLLAYFWGCGIV